MSLSISVILGQVKRTVFVSTDTVCLPTIGYLLWIPTAFFTLNFLFSFQFFCPTQVTELLNIINQTFMEEAFNSYRSASLGSSASFKTPSDKSTTKSSSPSDSGNSSSRTSGTSDGESQQSLPTLNSNRCSTASSASSSIQTQVSSSPYEDWEWNGVSFVKSPSPGVLAVSYSRDGTNCKLMSTWVCVCRFLSFASFSCACIM